MRGFLRADREVAAAQDSGVLMGPLLDEYTMALRAKGVARSSIATAKRMRLAFGDYLVTELTPANIHAYCAGRSAVSGPTIRRELVAVVAALHWAARHGKIPVGGRPVIDLPAHGAPRTTCLSEDEADRLFALASKDTDASGRLTRTGVFACIGLETGARKAAVEGLTWDRVYLTRGLIDFRDPARPVTRKRRVATPITDRLQPVLERAWRERDAANPWVLGRPGSIAETFRSFVVKHGFGAAITPHILRHTRVTLLLRAEVPLWDVGQLVGASEKVLAATYAHATADSRLRALANRRAA